MQTDDKETEYLDNTIDRLKESNKYIPNIPLKNSTIQILLKSKWNILQNGSHVRSQNKS